MTYQNHQAQEQDKGTQQTHQALGLGKGTYQTHQALGLGKGTHQGLGHGIPDSPGKGPSP